MRAAVHTLLALLLLVLSLFLACKEKEDENPGGDYGGGIPAGIARIAGQITDPAGTLISDASLRVTYDFITAGPAAAPLVGTVAIFYTNQMLTTECSGIIPLSDGIPIRIFWDQDGDGPDATDPQPLLCTNPPDCESGPARTVNFNEFLLNGQSVELGAGTFYTESAFTTVGDVQDPSRYYLRIYCTDGAILWESNVATLAEGPGEYEFTFQCDSCDSPPIVPEWSLGQAYPNPTLRTATLLYGLLEATTATLTLQRQGSNRIDTLFSEPQASGGHNYQIDFGPRANGLYDYRLAAPGFSQSKQLLLNNTQASGVRTQEPMTTTDPNGYYQFDTAAGVTIDRRDSTGFSQGAIPLQRIHILASKSGYFDSDSVITINSQDSLFIALTLRPR